MKWNILVLSLPMKSRVLGVVQSLIALRICINFTHLNKFIQREFHPSNSPYEAVTSIPAEELKYFCKFDARHGYWQIPLHPESCPLTCFITPFGRYVCNRAAFGISSISEWYNRRMDKVVNGLNGIRKIVDDDVLVYAPTLSTLKKRVHDFLDPCSTHEVTLKRSKSQIAVREADFGGFHLSERGIQCSFDLLKSICDFPRYERILLIYAPGWPGESTWKFFPRK